MRYHLGVLLRALLLALAAGGFALAEVAAPPRVFIPGLAFAFQTYNNCGPAAVSGILGYYGYRVSQDEVRRVLRPSGGYMRSDVIDPFVRPYGLRASRFKGGHLPAIKALVGRGIPVIVLQWLDRPQGIPHFRVVRGYDDTKGVVWVSDSMYGGSAYITYPDFERLWAGMSREMIPVYPAAYERLVSSLLGVSGPI